MADPTNRKPFSVQSDALDPEVTAALEEAFRTKATVTFEGAPWLVQKVETHPDPGPGVELKRFTLLPADPTADERDPR